MLREKAVEELESTRHVAHRLLEEIPPPIPDHATQKLIKLEESPGGLAYWMAVMLSAPSIPVRAALLQPARSDQLIRHDETALPFLPAERPEPVAKSKTGETTFRGSRLDFRAVESLGLVYKSTRGNVSEGGCRLGCCFTLTGIAGPADCHCEPREAPEL